MSNTMRADHGHQRWVTIAAALLVFLSSGTIVARAQPEDDERCDGALAYPCAVICTAARVCLSPSPTPTETRPGPRLTPTPSPSTSPEPASVARSLRFELRGHLRAVGSLSADHEACRTDIPISIERKASTGWVAIDSTRTRSDGAFELGLRDRRGRYRAVAPEIRLPEWTCLRAVSPIARHSH